ncbi:MAG: hypothetical protein HQ538_04815 [Parcubacteria group bacterium]|nr:hypothetical protein [Parcubacteria group bacterium]
MKKITKLINFAKKAGVSNLASLVIFIIVMILVYFLIINKFDFQATVTDILGIFATK